MADSLGHAASLSFPSVLIVIDTVNPHSIINPSNIALKIKLCPNPANEALNVRYENNAKAIFVLTYITGRILLQQQITKGTQQINLVSLAGRPYIAMIQAEDGAVYRQKILKQ